MVSDIDKQLLTVTTAAEIVAFLATVYFFFRVRNTVSILLIVLMSVIMVTETMGSYREYFSPHVNVFLIQNIEMLFELAIDLFLFYFTVLTPRHKKVIAIMIGVYLICAVLFSVYWQPLTLTFPTKCIAIGGIFILASILIYFYEGLAREKLFYKDYMFYISVGMFIFFANEIPAMTLFNYYLEHSAAIEKVRFIFRLKLISGSIYYLLYSFGLLWTTRKLPF